MCERPVVLVLAVLGLLEGIVPGTLPAAQTGTQRMIEMAIKAGELDSARKRRGPLLEQFTHRERARRDRKCV